MLTSQIQRQSQSNGLLQFNSWILYIHSSARTLMAWYAAHTAYHVEQSSSHIHRQVHSNGLLRHSRWILYSHSFTRTFRAGGAICIYTHAYMHHTLLSDVQQPYSKTASKQWPPAMQQLNPIQPLVHQDVDCLTGCTCATLIQVMLILREMLNLI